MISADYPFEDVPVQYRERPVFVMTSPTRLHVTSVAADFSRYGPAVRCFLSPFDALLEMLFLRRKDLNAVEAVARSSLLPLNFIRVGSGNGRSLCIWGGLRTTNGWWRKPTAN
ncbi:hypothetical protein [Burkholderia sp. AU38729]|uniref:hypothetical protein n=1 Tax=Burkholderia sp. AU38729 TaxID=2879633 RepID=UPI001CF16B30|nr:hypothetical protein [Burkholderia sp. AU38729]MCA8061083.1 hypothetical protein [Burkholderia sp. AU38729]